MSLSINLRRKLVALSASTLFLVPAPTLLAAEPGPIGSEFQVNTKSKSFQVRPDVAMDPTGDFVVVWQSINTYSGRRDEIHAQRYNAAGVAQGSEIRVSTVPQAKVRTVNRDPSVAIDASGNFVVAWQGSTASGAEILARRYAASGALQGAEFVVNTKTTDNQERPVVAMDADGDFAIAWRSYPGGRQIRAQRFNASGIRQGGEIIVPPGNSGRRNDSAPAIAMDASGNFVVAWQFDSNGGTAIRAQRFGAAGIPLGGEISVNTIATGVQFYPAIAIDADGDFAVVWYSSGNGTSGYRMQRFNAAGVPRGGEVDALTGSFTGQGVPDIAMDAAGDFVVLVGEGYGFDAPTLARRFDAAGLPQGEQFEIDTAIGLAESPAIAMDADGDFVVTWETLVGSDGNINAQRFQGLHPVDVTLVQSDSTDTTPAGAPFSYTLNVSNLETPATLTGIGGIDSAVGSASRLRVVDTLSSTPRSLSISGDHWVCTAAGQALSCDYDVLLAAGLSASPLTITLTAPDKPGRTLSHRAVVSADQIDGRPENNEVIEATLVQ